MKSITAQVVGLPQKDTMFRSQMLQNRLRSAVRFRGFTLIELAIVVSLMSIIAMGALYWQMQSMRGAVGNSIGDNLIELDAAVSKSYVIKNYSALLGNNSIAGVSNAYAPTIAELQAGGYLSQTFSPTNMLGSGYTIQVAKVPSGCVAPNCDLQSLVFPSSPILQQGSTTRPDSVVLSAAQTHIGGNAGTSIDTPATLSGPGGSWSMVNPMNQVGIIAVRGGYNSSGLSGFLMASGATPISNVVTVGAPCATTGTFGIDTNGSFIMCQSSKWTAQGGASASQWKDPVANFAALPSSGNSIGDVRMTNDTQRVFAWTGSGWQAVASDQNGNMSIIGNVTAGTVQLSTVNTAGAACTTNGMIATSSIGTTLSCRNNVWVTQGGTWKDPVASRSALPTNGNTNGDMRVTLDFDIPYIWAKWTWLPLAADENGNMTVSGTLWGGTLGVNGLNTPNSACTTLGMISRDTNSNIMSCKQFKWAPLAGNYVSSESLMLTKGNFGPPNGNTTVSYPAGSAGTSTAVITIQVAINGTSPCADSPTLTFTTVGTSYSVKQRLTRTTTAANYSWNNTFTLPIGTAGNPQLNVAWTGTCGMVSDSALNLNIYFAGTY